MWLQGYLFKESEQMKRKFLSSLPYVFIALFCLEIFLTPFGSGDELWNYNFAKNIAEGLKPYADISVIQTPLSACISGAFFKIFGRGMLTYRVVGYLLMASIFVVLATKGLRGRDSDL